MLLIMDVYTQFYSYIRYFLYECETWSLTLREEHRLRVSENRVLSISISV
jgi:hypothetical protein